MIHEPVFDGVVPAILDMVQQVILIPYMVLPEPTLPQAVFTSLVMAGTARRGWHRAGKAGFDPAQTRIQTSRSTSTAISALRVGDVVLGFDARAGKGRGALVPRRVTWAYRNTTTDWIRLRWFDGTAREGVTTPGHHASDAWGAFPTTPEMTRTGSATVVLASGGLMQVTAERTPFCADTAPLVERAMGLGGGVGTAAGKVGERDRWAGGAVEGEGGCRYGAGGVMGRGRRRRRRGAGSVHMWTFGKLTEMQRSVNFRSSDVNGIMRPQIRGYESMLMRIAERLLRANCSSLCFGLCADQESSGTLKLLSRGEIT